MRERITPHRVANSIQMQRSQYLGAWLLVEGEKDKTIYKRFIDAQKCRIQSPFCRDNKNNVLRVVEILEQNGFDGVVAILDADFWIVENRQIPSENILLTDTHDLEIMILKSPAFDKLLDELASVDKLARFSKERSSVRDALLEMGQFLGFLRWVSQKDAYSLNFNDLDFTKIVTIKTFALVSDEEIVRVVKNNTIAKSPPEQRGEKYALDEQTILRGVRDLQTGCYDLWHICCGHDLICILSIALRRVLASHNTKEVAPGILERELRLAYESSYFAQTHLYQAIRAWEVSNPSFQILL